MVLLISFFQLPHNLNVDSVFNNIPTVGQLPPGSDYFFFKDGIVPAWEDPHHVGGGQFTVALTSGGRDRDAPKGGPKSSSDWEALWLNAVIPYRCHPLFHRLFVDVGLCGLHAREAC